MVDTERVMNMMKILVAGAGHGGLVAAGLLAKQGADVTVIERGVEENLGHDWTDIFKLECFEQAGIPLPPEHEYERHCEMTFFGPSCNGDITARGKPEESTEFMMERRIILRHLIQFARGNGAKLVFETEIDGPVIEGERVAGLMVGGKELRADLVVDAAGMDSPVRRQLPANFGIVKDFRRDQYFTIYRAFYGCNGKPPSKDHFSVYFLPLGRTGVAWFANEDGYVDLLCGSFEDTDQAYAEQVRQAYKHRHPNMGDEICRGGQVANVPVRRAISRMVANGYAAVGDSVGMTIPLNGSGIANAIHAGRILAETVLASNNCTAKDLWPFQVAYMRQFGAACASLDVFKRFMLTMQPRVIDFLFDKKILTPIDMNRARTGQEITFTLPDLLARGLRGAAHMPTMLRLARTYAASQKLKRCAMNIPETYDEQAIAAWAAKYDGV